MTSQKIADDIELPQETLRDLPATLDRIYARYSGQWHRLDRAGRAAARRGRPAEDVMSDYLATADVWTVLDLIAAEFQSDPMSVRCFDLRLVNRAVALAAARRHSGLRCLDCGLAYALFALDLTLPDDQWRLIHPAEHGVLCATCITRRAAAVPGSVALRARIEFGEDPRR